MASKTVTRFFDVGKNKSLVLLLCSAFTRHLGPSSISIFVLSLYSIQMKRVWKPCSEIRAKTVETRVLGSSLSSSRPSAAILVSERSDRSTLSDLLRSVRVC